MDEVVYRAMQKWPNVPAEFGWLALNTRGQWLIRGERITNVLLNQFIGRNYGRDDRGRWYFQNGPQRVFVSLAYAPWVLRAEAEELVTHTGQAVGTLHGVWIDECGSIIMSTEFGPASLDDRDSDLVSSRFVHLSGQPPTEDRLIEFVEQLVAGRECDLYLPYAGQTVQVLPIRRVEVASRFGFVADPRPSSEELKRDASVA